MLPAMTPVLFAALPNASVPLLNVSVGNPALLITLPSGPLRTPMVSLKPFKSSVVAVFSVTTAVLAI